MCSDGTKDYGVKLILFKFWIRYKEEILPYVVVKHWNRYRRKTVYAPSLEEFRAGLDGALGNLGLKGDVSACSRRLKVCDLEGSLEV